MVLNDRHSRFARWSAGQDFKVMHRVIIVVVGCIALTSSLGSYIWAERLEFERIDSSFVSLVAGALAFLLIMAPIVLASVWTRASWGMKLTCLPAILGLLALAAAVQYNAFLAFDNARKDALIQDATDRYNTAIYTLDSIVLPHRDCLCPELRRADMREYDAKRKTPLLDKMKSESDLSVLRTNAASVGGVGKAAILVAILAFFARCTLIAVSMRLRR